MLRLEITAEQPWATVVRTTGEPGSGPGGNFLIGDHGGRGGRLGLA